MGSGSKDSKQSLNLWKKITRKLSYDSLSTKLPIFFEKLRGVDFSTEVHVDELGLDPNLSVGYHPSGDKYLRQLLKGLVISNQDRILDIGCGKGSAILVMLKFPFAQVDGVEISEDLAKIARRNFKLLGVPAGRIHIVRMNAAKFTQLDAYNFIYLYNPFRRPVFRNVLSNLTNSLKRKPRKMTLIYNNPAYHDDVLNSGFFELASKHPDKWGNKIFVYTNSKRPTE